MRKVIMLAALACAVAFSAHAADLAEQVAAGAASTKPKHTVDMTALIKNLDGKPMKDADGQDRVRDPSCDKCPNLTVGHVVANVLLMPERGVPAADLWARGMLAMRLRENPRAPLTTEEAVVIKRLLAQNYPAPLVMMQVLPLIDPNDKPGSVKP